MVGSFCFYYKVSLVFVKKTIALVRLCFFFPAGADLIITNTYQASVDGFMEHLKLSEKESYDLIKESVKLAKIAREAYKKEFPESSEWKRSSLCANM